MESAIFKVCILGDGGVGKTTLVNRYLSGRFSETTKMTIGVDLATKHFRKDGVKITLQIWDLGGEERFRFFLPAYARGSFGGIFIYDTTRYNSLKNLDEWINIFKRGAQSERYMVPILMVGAKLDLEEKRSVFPEDALKRSQDHEIYDVIECSSKTGYNVEQIFSNITEEIMSCMGLV